MRLREGIYIPETTDSGLYTGFIVYNTGETYGIRVFSSCTWDWVVDRAEFLRRVGAPDYPYRNRSLGDDVPVFRCGRVE